MKIIGGKKILAGMAVEAMRAETLFAGAAYLMVIACPRCRAAGLRAYLALDEGRALPRTVNCPTCSTRQEVPQG